MSGKPLVTFAAGSPFDDPKLGVPIFLASLDSGAQLQRLRTWVMSEGRLSEAQSFAWPLGHLDGLRAQTVTAVCGDQMYNLLCRYVGLQEAIRIAP